MLQETLEQYFRSFAQAVHPLFSCDFARHISLPSRFLVTPFRTLPIYSVPN
jgi:hypothetical protein